MLNNFVKSIFIRSFLAINTAILLLIFLTSCSTNSSSTVTCTFSDPETTNADINRTLGTVKTGSILYFEDKIPFDQNCAALRPMVNYNGLAAQGADRTDDTQRVQHAMFEVSQIDRNGDGKPEGGVLYLRASESGTQNTYRLARLTVPSNIRIVVDPDVTLMMIGGEVSRRHIDGSKRISGNGKTLTRNNQHMFAIGNSEFTKSLDLERTQNVEITSSHEGEMFTVDQRTEFPLNYRYRKKGQLRDNGVKVEKSDPQEYGITSTFASPFFIGYAKNVAVSDVNVLDNYTYLPAVAIYPDADMTDGILNAKRHKGQSYTDANGNLVRSRMLIEDAGNKVTDMMGYERNPTYGRTATHGAFVNIKTDRAHGGFGLIQIWGGDTVYMNELHGTGGITVRLEPGAGIENLSRAGPGLGDIHTVEIENISVRDGFTALWLNPHSKDNYNVRVRNVSAYDSGSAVLMDKTSQDSLAFPDLYVGTFKDIKISGNIHMTREHETPRAEIGYIASLVMHPGNIAKVRDVDGYGEDDYRSGKPDGQVTSNDMPAGPSGDRWFMVDPIVPVIAINRMSEDNFNHRDLDGDGTLEAPIGDFGFYDVDMSDVTFTRGGSFPIAHTKNIQYRNDMRRIDNGRPALSMINK